MKNKTMCEVARCVENHWGTAPSKKIISDAEERWRQLCLENQTVCPEKKTHLFNNLFPCISYYEAMQKNGIDRWEALDFLDQSWSEQAKKGAAQTKKLLGVCGLYKWYPAMFQWVAKHQFGEKAGFSAKFYTGEKKRCKFDMTKCLFLDTCQKYGCPELTQCFCHTDDINNADLHPKLCWNRTQFMGNGGAYCDFDIYVR